MSRPAKSMAVAVSHGSSMLAFLAAIIEWMTRSKLPPARMWLSICCWLTSMPARPAWMRALTTVPELTLRRLMPIRSTNPTRAPLTSAWM